MRCLPAFLALFALVPGWVRADDKKADDVKSQVVGKWVAQDANKNPVEFNKDGTAKIGFIKEGGKWIIVDGTWSIADDGRILAKGSHGGATFGQWWRFKDGNLVGPMGPNPFLTWVRVKEKDDNKKE